MKQKPSKRPCPLCGTRSDIRIILSGRFETMGKDYFVSECGKCGFIFQNPAWPRLFYEGIYKTLIYDPVKIPYPPEEIKRFEEIEKIIHKLGNSKKKMRLLDYGCYDGSFTEWLIRSGKNANVEVFGYDVALKDEAVTNPRYFNDAKKLAEKKFDVVTLNHVLEHVYNPLKLLKFIKEHLLAPNGYIVIELPDTSFVRAGDFTPVHIQHVNYFTPETLATALKRSGLSTHSLSTFQNYDIDRDPCYPSVIIVGQNNQKYLPTGLDFAKEALRNRQILKKRFNSLPAGTDLGIVGCGDPLGHVIKMLPKKVRLVGLYDNNKDIWGKKIFGHTINAASSLCDNSCDTVFVCTVHERKSKIIEKKLRSDGFKGKIIKVFDHV